MEYDIQIYENTAINVNTSLFLQNRINKEYFTLAKTKENSNINLFLFQTYSWSFGHVLSMCMLNYAAFLKNKDILSGYHFSNISLNKKNHITDFVEIVSKIEGRPIYHINDGIHYFNKIARDDMQKELGRLYAFPTPAFNNANEAIKKHIFKKRDNYPKKLAIIKTSADLDGKNTSNRFFNKEQIKQVCDQTGFTLINHYDMHLSEILQYIYNCETLLVSWGATAYYSIFLERPRKCICFYSNEYKSQAKNKSICFNSDLCDFTIINNSFSASLPPDQRNLLINKINSAFI